MNYQIRLVLASLVCVLCSGSLGAQAANRDPANARIIATDVANFWLAYDSLSSSVTTADSLAILGEHYLDRASPGLTEYVRLRVQDPQDLLMGIRLAPRYLAAVRPNTERLLDAEGSIRAGMNNLAALYPEAVFPDIYFLYAGFIAMGVESAAGILIAAEMVSADEETPTGELPPALRGVTLSREVVPCLVVHELVHAQQDYAPGRSLLKQALLEGVADFVAEIAVGCKPTAPAVYQYGAAHEAALWSEFQAAMYETDLRMWLYNGNQASDRPANLGYWMGYTIAKAYYDRQPDKTSAIRRMLRIRDFRGFLEESGYGLN